MSVSPLKLKDIFQTWWPLAAGWLLMTAEIPLITAVVARNPDPKIHLAAWGIAFPLVLIFGSPVMMFLAASTASSYDPAPDTLATRPATLKATPMLRDTPELARHAAADSDTHSLPSLRVLPTRDPSVARHTRRAPVTTNIPCPRPPPKFMTRPACGRPSW